MTHFEHEKLSTYFNASRWYDTWSEYVAHEPKHVRTPQERRALRVEFLRGKRDRPGLGYTRAVSVEECAQAVTSN